MKAKLIFALTLFALTLAQNVSPSQCSAFCARVRCIGGQICGLYTNAQGQTVCGCHPR
jgi:hypothetical protein